MGCKACMMSGCRECDCEHGDCHAWSKNIQDRLELAVAVIKELRKGKHDCESLHHPKKFKHGDFDPCPIELHIRAALMAWEEKEGGI